MCTFFLKKQHMRLILSMYRGVKMLKFKTMNMYFTWVCWIRIDVDVSTELFKVKTAFIGILGKLQFCISLFSERINGVNEKTFAWRSIGLDQLKKILSGKRKKRGFWEYKSDQSPCKCCIGWNGFGPSAAWTLWESRQRPNRQREIQNQRRGHVFLTPASFDKWV